MLSLGLFAAFTKELIHTTVMFNMTVLFIIVPGFRKKKKTSHRSICMKVLGGAVFVSCLFFVGGVAVFEDCPPFLFHFCLFDFRFSPLTLVDWA